MVILIQEGGTYHLPLREGNPSKSTSKEMVATPNTLYSRKSSTKGVLVALFQKILHPNFVCK